LKTIRLAALLSALILAACGGASGPAFKPEQTPRNFATVYVYRPHQMVGILSSKARYLNIDDRQVTRIKLGGYIALSTTPGPHTLTSTDFSTFGDTNTGKVMASARFTVTPGSVRCFRYTEGWKSLTAIPSNGTVFSRARVNSTSKKCCLRLR
jgi:surface antigen